jgi:hypothetical protein
MVSISTRLLRLRVSTPRSLSSAKWIRNIENLKNHWFWKMDVFLLINRGDIIIIIVIIIIIIIMSK